MYRKLKCGCFITVFFFVFSANVQASGIPTADLLAFAQRLIDVMNQLEQISSMAQNVTNTYSIINNLISSLRTVDSAIYGSVGSSVNSSINTLQNFLNSIDGIKYNIGYVRSQFDTIFPSDPSQWDRVKLADISTFISDWNSMLSGSSKNAMEAQSSIANLIHYNELTRSILQQSGSGGGQTSQLQSVNQMLGVLNSQMGLLNLNLAANGRVMATAQAATAAERQAAISKSQLRMQDYTRQNTVHPAFSELPSLR